MSRFRDTDSTMIFQYTWPEVLRERKTQTRRVARENEMPVRARYNRIEAVYVNDRVKWRVGETYAVQQKRGQSQIARIRLERIRRQTASRITSADARAEGFASRKEFLNVWRQIHGPKSEKSTVWVLEFVLASVVVDASNLSSVPLSLPLGQPD